jgi:cytidylate kinase
MHFVSFSRTLGSGGTEVARLVAEKMGYKFADTDEIDRAARLKGFVQSVEELDGKPPSFFERYFSDRPEINLERLNAVIYEMAKQGDTLFVGRGGQVLLRAFECALHVRITASVETRVRNLVERGYHETAAIKAMERSDHERGSFIRFAFGVDWGDTTLYDVVLNMDKVSVNLAVETILTMARSSDMKSCSSEALQSLKNMALENKARAAIIEAGLSSGKLTTVFVSVSGTGRVQLTGVTKDEEIKERAGRILENLEGVDSIDNQITVIPESVGAV